VLAEFGFELAYVRGLGAPWIAGGAGGGLGGYGELFELADGECVCEDLLDELFAAIFFLDEAGVRSDQVLGRTWGLRGRTPEVPTSGKRQSVSAISAVNARGEFWFEIYTERLNATKFVDLLTHFMRRRKSPVLLILDSHPAHIAKSVARYVQSLKGRLELHFLPGYAPELNPDEFVWNHLKKQGVSKKPLLKDESLRQRVNADLLDIQSRPDLVRSFFNAPSVAYTAD